MATIKVGRSMQAFLDLIALSEGTSTAPETINDGYDVIVDGVWGHNYFSDYSIHPFALGRAPIIVRAGKPSTPLPPTGSDYIGQHQAEPAIAALYSTASGRYQLILPTWLELAAKIHLRTFGPQNQDLAAVQLIHEANADLLIDALEIDKAIEALCETWASFPGNLYQQGGRTMEWLLANYRTLVNAQSV